MHRSLIRSALAGATAAALWAVVEVPLSRVLDTGFTDVSLLGRCSGLRGRRGTAAGVVIHLVNGAAFGVAFAELGGRGARAGFAAAEIEGTVLWPAMRMLDPEHFTKRVFAQEAVTHGLFGVTLGLASPRSAARSTL